MWEAMEERWWRLKTEPVKITHLKAFDPVMTVDPNCGTQTKVKGWRDERERQRVSESESERGGLAAGQEKKTKDLGNKLASTFWIWWRALGMTLVWLGGWVVKCLLWHLQSTTMCESCQFNDQCYPQLFIFITFSFSFDISRI